MNKNPQPTTYNLQSSKGFTLIETLIAISVLLLAVVGPLTVATQSLTSAAFARDQIVAFYLAQEATEVIRNKRDNNALSNSNWDSGFADCVSVDPCRIDATVSIDSGQAIEKCDTGACPPLRRDTTSGLYGYNGAWPESKYTREIQMESVGTENVSGDEIRILVTISWQTGPLQKSFTIQENIMNWQ